MAEQGRQPERARLSDILIEHGVIQQVVVDAAADKQKRVEDKRSVESKSVKVPAERLDALIDRVGELVIAGVGTHLQISHINRPELM